MRLGVVSPRWRPAIREALGEHELDAIPQKDLRTGCADFDWYGARSVVSFELAPPGGKFPERWVEIEIELRTEAGLPARPVILIDHGSGYAMGTRIRLPEPVRDRVRAMVRLPEPVRGLRLIPLDWPGKFSLGAVRIRMISAAEAAIRLVLPRARALARTPWQMPRALNDAYALWRSEGLLGLKRQLAGETGSRSEAPLPRYANWIERYDTLHDSDRNAIRKHLGTLKFQPLISLILPLRDSTKESLQRTLESVQSQLYSKWQLFVVGDFSNRLQIGDLVEQYRLKDSRIQVAYERQNSNFALCLRSGFELAGGEFVLILQETDLLREHALYLIVQELNAYPGSELIYGDEDSLNSAGERFNPRFKPDWNPDLFYACNYISHFVAVRTDLVKRVGGFRENTAGDQQFDLLLRATAAIDPGGVRHLPYVLGHSGSALKFVESRSNAPSARRAWYPIPEDPPLVSLLLVAPENLPPLQRCVESITTRTDYPRYEIVIVDKGRRDRPLLELLSRPTQSGRIRVVNSDLSVNCSGFKNFAAGEAKGAVFAILSNDLEVVSSDWLREMVSHALRPEVGAVGGKLYYLNEEVQHPRVALGTNGLATQVHRRFGREEGTDCGRVELVQNVSVVSAPCFVMRRELFEQLHGFDEALLAELGNIDLCLRLQELGYRLVFTPHAELYHYERGTDVLGCPPEKLDRLRRDIEIMERRWGPRLRHDPHFSPNLSLDGVGCLLAFPPRTQRPWLSFTSPDPVQ